MTCSAALSPQNHNFTLSEAVLDAAKSGAPWALERVYCALAPVVIGYLRVQGAQEPEDLTAEVFVAVLTSMHRFTGDGVAFRSWLFTIAHRRLTDERRRRSRRPPMDPIDEAALTLPEGTDVEAQVLARISTQYVQALCSTLTDDQRDVLLLRLVADFSIEDVALVVDKQPGAVKALQHRALATLRRRLAVAGGESSLNAVVQAVSQ